MNISIDYWQRFRKWVGLPQTFAPTYVEDIPDTLEPKKLYVVGEDTPWSAAMLCPCGCRSIIHVSLIADDDPSWQLTFSKDGKATLHPSVWRIKGCRSHFFLRSNRIIWAKGMRMVGFETQAHTKQREDNRQGVERNR